MKTMKTMFLLAPLFALSTLTAGCSETCAPAQRKLSDEIRQAGRMIKLIKNEETMISTAPSQELKLIATHQTNLCMLLMSLHTIEMELLDIGFAVHKLQQTAAEVPQEMSQQWNDLQEKRALIDAQIRVTAHSVENLAATLGF